MARENPRLRPERRDHVLLRAAHTWNALAIAAIALMLVAPSLVVGALTLLEGLLSNRRDAPRLTAAVPQAHAPAATTTLPLPGRVGAQRAPAWGEVPRAE
jgi:hypothetical protein